MKRLDWKAIVVASGLALLVLGCTSSSASPDAEDATPETQDIATPDTPAPQDASSQDSHGICPSPPCAGWTQAASLPEARTLHTAALLTDGKVLVTGGADETDNTLATTRIFDPATNTWATNLGMMLMPHESFTATVMDDGRVLAVGGNSFSPTAQTEIFSAKVWGDGGTLTTARAGHTATLLEDGRVLVTGGGGGSVTLRSSEIFDPAVDAWAAGPDMPNAHANHATVRLADGRVLVCGGSDSNGSASPNVDIYQPANNDWVQAAPMSTGRYRHTATLLSDGTVLVVGGFNDDSAEHYDPETDKWTSAGTLAGGRYNHTASLLSDGRVIVVGGYNSAEFKLKRVEAFDSSTGWSEIVSLPTAVEEHTATVLNDGTLLVIGGRGDKGNISHVYLFTPSTP